MISFLLSIVALVLGYIIYGAFVDRVFGPDPKRITPAVEKADGVDYIAMPTWKVFMIQFLNIAGTGPIFGAIMGAKFGPASYLWIVLGCIFAGAVHDYMCGMLSVRNGGAGFPELVGKYLGGGAKKVMLVFSIILLLLVGTVFVYSPALILGDIAGDGSRGAIMIWVGVIFVYYVVATLLPIDKLIGRIYPLFAFALLFMAAALMVCLFVKWPSIPEVWDGLGGWSAKAGLKGQPIFPCLFITIACGAISGFHATQSPLMARCIQNEKLGRPVFYGSMITEGLVALIWAAVSSWFFFDGGAAEVGSTMSASAAPQVVTKVSEGWLGLLGGILAIIGVVAAPITSGDTAFRSARLIVADFLKMPQKAIGKRLVIAVPLFALSAILLWYNIADENGFNTIWRYFGWSNQTLATIMLWTATAYFVKRGGLNYLLTLLPAMFMTAVCVTFICVDKIGFRMPEGIAPWLGLATFIVSGMVFWLLKKRSR